MRLKKEVATKAAAVDAANAAVKAAITQAAAASNTAAEPAKPAGPVKPSFRDTGIKRDKVCFLTDASRTRTRTRSEEACSHASPVVPLLSHRPVCGRLLVVGGEDQQRGDRFQPVQVTPVSYHWPALSSLLAPPPTNLHVIILLITANLCVVD